LNLLHHDTAISWRVDCENLRISGGACSCNRPIATVRTQIQSIREKLQVRSIDELLLRAAAVPPVAALH
jgi:hypothetical protein